MSVDDAVLELYEACSVLSDPEFERKHPGIMGVASFLHNAAKTHYAWGGKFEPFDRLGVGDITGYMELFQQGNTLAIETYKNIKEILVI